MNLSRLFCSNVEVRQLEAILFTSDIVGWKDWSNNKNCNLNALWNAYKHMKNLKSAVSDSRNFSMSKR